MELDCFSLGWKLDLMLKEKCGGREISVNDS